ncbi:MAG: phosphoribosylanthranilate isomerase [Gallionella sp.]|nr:phosphoribosylanthranilate isomerase [Gallionella sp.]
MPVRVKICGITRAEDALAVAMSGADAIGLVFYEKSPRHVSIGQAAKLAAVLPPFVTVVGLFVNASAETVREVLAAVPLDVLQFHGDESPQFCAQFNKPYLKAIRVKVGVDLLQCAARFHTAQGLLLDAHVEGIPGGTGACFDWTLIPEALPLPLILSGGLSVENVAAGIRQVRPYAVDVSSGVEVSKGIDTLKGINTLKGVKDAAKIARFMQEVKSV